MTHLSLAGFELHPETSGGPLGLGGLRRGVGLKSFMLAAKQTHRVAAGLNPDESKHIVQQTDRKTPAKLGYEDRIGGVDTRG